MDNNKDFFFECKSPGKVIISGEHAVVYNSKAIACAINLYTRCNLSAIHLHDTKDIHKYLTLHLTNFQTELHIEKSKLNLCDKYIEILKGHFNGKKVNLDEVFNINTIAFLGKRLPYVLDNIDEKIDKKAIFLIHMFNLIFSYFIFEYDLFDKYGSIYSQLMDDHNINLQIRSEIPYGAGLGSSAAYTITLTASILVSKFYNLI
jgi:mevalonate kinase